MYHKGHLKVLHEGQRGAAGDFKKRSDKFNFCLREVALVAVWTVRGRKKKMSGPLEVIAVSRWDLTVTRIGQCE